MNKTSLWYVRWFPYKGATLSQRCEGEFCYSSNRDEAKKQFMADHEGAVIDTFDFIKNIC